MEVVVRGASHSLLYRRLLINSAGGVCKEDDSSATLPDWPRRLAWNKGPYPGGSRDMEWSRHRRNDFSRFGTIGSRTIAIYMYGCYRKFLALYRVHLLSNHVGRAFAFPKPEKDRVPQPIISGPFRKSDLANHRGLDPMATFHFGGG
jgi:hypothetical protein